MSILNMDTKILVTIGPSSFQRDVITQLEKESIYLFRINLSHTAIDSIEEKITEIRNYTDIPICLDSEGAQIRNHAMSNGVVFIKNNDVIVIHYDEILGDEKNISFSPSHVGRQLQVGDEIRIDYNSARIKVFEKTQKHCLAMVIEEGWIGSNKAADVNRNIKLDPLTFKDHRAIEICKKMNVNHFALSFTGSGEDVKRVRELIGNKTSIISKIESIAGLNFLGSIINSSDAILIDRGDLSRQVELAKIPFLQRRIVSTARSRGMPVYVATNLLESMVKRPTPTRAEINDVVSTLLMGANGLVLAAETAIGKFPVEAVKMVRRLINQFERWTPNTSISELLED